MPVYDSVAGWINTFLACFGGCSCCLGFGVMDEPQKGTQSQSQLLVTSFSEDFWGSSTCDIDIPFGLLQRSFTSLNTPSLNLLPDPGPKTTISHNEYVNHGLLLWTKQRLQWIGAIKYTDEPHQASGPHQAPSISLNASYDSLLTPKGGFRRPIPLAEMVDFLVDIWENEGLYD